MKHHLINSSTLNFEMNCQAKSISNQFSTDLLPIKLGVCSLRNIALKQVMMANIMDVKVILNATGLMQNFAFDLALIVCISN
jgi:hypothetical protein